MGHSMAPDSYPLRELGIALLSKRALAGEGERSQEGDIISCRHTDTGGLGLKTAHRYLWFCVEGLRDWEFDRLTQRLTEPPGLPSEDDNPTFDKRRYCVPLVRLKGVAPFLDLARLRDPLDNYQPFRPVDQDDDNVRSHFTFFPGSARAPLRIEGLIYDKAMGAFL